MSSRALRNRGKKPSEPALEHSEKSNIITNIDESAVHSEIRERASSKAKNPSEYISMVADTSKERKDYDSNTTSRVRTKWHPRRASIVIEPINVVAMLDTQEEQEYIDAVDTDIQEDFFTQLEKLDDNRVASASTTDPILQDIAREHTVPPVTVNLESASEIELVQENSKSEIDNAHEECNIDRDTSISCSLSIDSNAPAPLFKFKVNPNDTKVPEETFDDDTDDPFGFTQAEKRIKTRKRNQLSQTSFLISPASGQNSDLKNDRTTSVIYKSAKESISGHLSLGNLEATRLAKEETVLPNYTEKKVEQELPRKKRYSEPFVEIIVKSNPKIKLEESPKKHRQSRSKSKGKNTRKQDQGPGLGTNRASFTYGTKLKIDPGVDVTAGEHLKHFVEIDKFELAEEFVF
ncbi:hypothetical protein K7432_003659 [Basidiobolus ranarum]|uniref:Uncharacterized protein n=1 Tax=Basidiobolus ranarum TaxID=34480 RepID=A0ABR2WZH7_9FUNG